MSEEPEEYISAPDVTPAEQDTILFYGQPLIVVRFMDGQPAVSIRDLCQNLDLERKAQVRRIQRTEAIASELTHNVCVQTEAGLRRIQVLSLRAVPFWLAGIDIKKVKDEIRPDLIRYQREVVDVLYAWAQSQKALPAATGLVPSEPLPEPVQPEQGAPLDQWIIYHKQMLEVLQWQKDMEQWQWGIEDRLEGIEAITGLIPEILERLGPQTLTPEHHRRVQTLAQQLQKATGKPHATIYNDLKTAFEKPRIQDLLEDEWPQVENWFTVQIERAKKRGK